MSQFDQDRPVSQGATDGRPGGMCRRTDEKTFAGLGSCQGQGQGKGRGMGMGMRSGKTALSGQTDRSREKGLRQLPSGSDDLSALKEQYRAAEDMLRQLGKKIAMIESGKK